jgi:hypothetical protein
MFTFFNERISFGNNGTFVNAEKNYIQIIQGRKRTEAISEIVPNHLSPTVPGIIIIKKSSNDQLTVTTPCP